MRPDLPAAELAIEAQRGSPAAEGGAASPGRSSAAPAAGRPLAASGGVPAPIGPDHHLCCRTLQSLSENIKRDCKVFAA